MNYYYQGIIFSKFVDVGTHYSLPVCCNSLLSNKRFFAAYIAFLMTPRLLMAIWMIPLYHTDKMNRRTIQSSIQFLVCRVMDSESVTCTTLLMTRCKGLTCGVRVIETYIVTTATNHSYLLVSLEIISCCQKIKITIQMYKFLVNPFTW